MSPSLLYCNRLGLHKCAHFMGLVTQKPGTTERLLGVFGKRRASPSSPPRRLVTQKPGTTKRLLGVFGKRRASPSTPPRRLVTQKPGTTERRSVFSERGGLRPPRRPGGWSRRNLGPPSACSVFSERGGLRPPRRLYTVFQGVKTRHRPGAGPGQSHGSCRHQYQCRRPGVPGS
jgi:hypothetical protein